MNLLLTSAGRRTYLVDYFKTALGSRGGRVFVGNSDPLAPALHVADGCFISPLIYDAEYESALLAFCKTNAVEMVISLLDIELPVLAALKESFRKEGIRIVVCDQWLAETANDKWQTQQFLKDHRFNTLPLYNSMESCQQALAGKKTDFPVFVKPRWGMGSISMYKAMNPRELEFYYEKAHAEIQHNYLKYESARDFAKAVLLQPAFPGDEYGLDIINDLEGNYCTTVIKKKLAMRFGETDAAITVDEPVLQDLGKRLSAITRHPANMDVDVFFDGRTPFILEMNPRYGGGYPFSHAAGVNLPEATVKWHRGEQVCKEQLLTPKTGVTGMKGVTMILKND